MHFWRCLTDSTGSVGSGWAESETEYSRTSSFELGSCPQDKLSVEEQTTCARRPFEPVRDCFAPKYSRCTLSGVFARSHRRRLPIANASRFRGRIMDSGRHKVRVYGSSCQAGTQERLAPIGCWLSATGSQCILVTESVSAFFSLYNYIYTCSMICMCTDILAAVVVYRLQSAKSCCVK